MPEYRYDDHGNPRDPRWPKERVGAGVVVAGYVLAILIPIVGLIVGIIVAAKGRLGHGIAILTLSVIVMSVAAILIASSPSNCVERARSVEQLNAC